MSGISLTRTGMLCNNRRFENSCFIFIGQLFPSVITMLSSLELEMQKYSGKLPLTLYFVIKTLNCLPLKYLQP